MDASILSQLLQIKWLLVAIAIVAVLGAVSRIRMEYMRSGGAERMLRDRFSARAYRLLDAAKHQELLELSKSRCIEFPGDATAYWYHALAAHRLGDSATALASMHKVGELQPDWREGYVLPFIRSITVPDSGPSTTAASPIASNSPGTQ